jgi:hypothetical protein
MTPHWTPRLVLEYAILGFILLLVGRMTFLLTSILMGW